MLKMRVTELHGESAAEMIQAGVSDDNGDGEDKNDSSSDEVEVTESS